MNKLKKQKEKLMELTPNSKMVQMAENPETRAEVVKRENISNLKTNQEKEVANKLLLGPFRRKGKFGKPVQKL